MQTLNILQQLYYNTYVLLTLKNNIFITIILKFSILLLISFIYNTDYIFCMFNGEESDRLSDIPPLDNEVIEHHTEGILFHKSDEYAQNFRDNYTSEEWGTLRPEEKILGPAFQCMGDTCQAETLYQDIANLPNKTFEQKLDLLQRAYIHESAEKQALEIDRNHYYYKALQRHESLLEAKETIKQLQERIAELENNIRK